MSPDHALIAVLSVAVVVLYLGLAATLREVREVRRDLSSLSADLGRDRSLDIRLSGLSDPADPSTVVAVVDQECPLCLAVLDELEHRRREDPVPAVVLAHGDLAPLETAYPTLDIRDVPEAWQELAHLTPPVLLTVDRSGSVIDMQLPANQTQARNVLQRWSATAEHNERRDDVA
jgi:hypothetical protein